MELFEAAGLPKGVINMVTVSGREIASVIFEDNNLLGWQNYPSNGANSKIIISTIDE